MSLRALRLTNFKRFLDVEIPLSPLTVLTGVNGGGKTSVLHALLLARQASAGAQRDLVELNGPFGLALGEVQDVLHLDADPDDGIGIALRDREDRTYAWRFGGSDDRSLHLRVLERPQPAPVALRGAARGFTYLSAERLGPRDVLGASSVATEDLHVGHQGEFTAHVLAVLDRRLQVTPGRQHPRTADSGGVITLRQQVEWWLSDIARPIMLDAEWLPGSGVTLIRYRTPGRPVDRARPTNMGFGVTYALPVVTAALMAPADSLLLVENPEAHLHPSGQSAIGAFLAQVAADGVQVVIETHSDHVINGIRRSVATAKRPAATDAAIQFFSADVDDRPRVAPIAILPHGELSEWPSGFFDQMDTDLAEIARTRRRGRP